MNRISMVAVLIAGTMPFTVGCATKTYTRNQVAPVINKTNELDDLTAKNTRDIRDTDQRAQAGIKDAQGKANTADQHALAAGQQADEANKNAGQVSNNVASLAGTVENLDNYKPVAESSVHFGFDKADLTKKAHDANAEILETCEKGTTSVETSCWDTRDRRRGTTSVETSCWDTRDRRRGTTSVETSCWDTQHRRRGTTSVVP